MLSKIYTNAKNDENRMVFFSNLIKNWIQHDPSLILISKSDVIKSLEWHNLKPQIDDTFAFLLRTNYIKLEHKESILQKIYGYFHKSTVISYVCVTNVKIAAEKYITNIFSSASYGIDLVQTIHEFEEMVQANNHLPVFEYLNHYKLIRQFPPYGFAVLHPSIGLLQPDVLEYVLKIKEKKFQLEQRILSLKKQTSSHLENYRHDLVAKLLEDICLCDHFLCNLKENELPLSAKNEIDALIIKGYL